MTKRRNRIVNRLVISVIRNIAGILVIASILVAIAVAVYALMDLRIVAQYSQPGQYEIYKPRENKLSLEELEKINPEVIGWLDIYGTNIDYPLLQGEDNDKYLMFSADLQYSLAGSIFLDCRNHPDFSDFNNIIHGHNMDFNVMFGDISDFLDRSFYDTHKYGDLFFEGEHHGLRIVGLVETEAYSSALYRPRIATDEEKTAFFEALDAEAKYKLAEEDKDPSATFVLLSTCSSGFTNGRHILVCQLTDETYKDPFGKPEKNKDTVGGPRVRIEFFIAIMIVFLLLICSVIILRRADLRRRRGGEELPQGASQDRYVNSGQGGRNHV